MKKAAVLLTLPLLIASYLDNMPTETFKPIVVEAEPVEAAVITPVIEPTVAAAPTEPEPVYLGEFKLTAYCSCSKCCGVWAEDRPLDEYGNEIVIGSTGEVLRSNYSIAVDPDVIPYDSIVIINGTEYEAQDTGGAINGNRIDVYFNSHEEALEFGVQVADVYLKGEVY